MTQRLSIAFMTTIGRNVGDEFIRDGIRWLLDQAGIAHDPLYVCKHDLETLHRRVYDETITCQDKFREADVIIQAGAPVYWALDKHRSYNESWSVPLWYERIFQFGHSKFILNLGAGSCQRSELELEPLITDPKLIDFARLAGRSCRWTTVRDPLASCFLDRIGVAHEHLACPAYFAARSVMEPTPRPAGDRLAINLMKVAGHYRLKRTTDAASWSVVIQQMLPLLRQNHRLVFVAHDQAEADFQQQFLQGDETIFLADSWRDYLHLYSQVTGIVANRVHGAVAVAGFGRPAVIIGNDSRIGIARPLDIPAVDSTEAEAGWVVQQLVDQFSAGERLFDDRINLQNQQAAHYIRRLREVLRPGVSLAA